VSAVEVRHVGVVGAGRMGSGIAEVVARAGTRVTFVEGTDDLVTAGRDRIERSIETAVGRGKLTDDQAREALSNIEGATDLVELATCEVVVEAATEERDAKREIFRRLGEIAHARAILASNTSSIPIVELGVASGRPDRVIGIHFFNPPPVMKLVELIPSVLTSADTAHRARVWVGALGKETVTSKDEAGFIVNRVLVPFLNDAIAMFDRGIASRDDIDAACRLGLGHPMGPLQLADLIGLDIVMQIGEVLADAFPEQRHAPPPLLRRMVAAGRLGRKSGEGFYRYD
jgi:3-hydroxybutyryl-CoA dehydrogenase